MSERNTLVRSLHDLGMAAWFGGSLMGATGLNGATSKAADPRERLRLSTSGWGLWTPWQVGAVAAHTVGGVGLLVSNRSRLKRQAAAGPLTWAKLALTVVAAGSTAYSGVLGAKLKLHEGENVEGATEPNPAADESLKAAQKQLKILQWAIPTLTGVLVVMGAVEGEQQRGPAGLLDTTRAAAQKAFAGIVN